MEYCQPRKLTPTVMFRVFIGVPLHRPGWFTTWFFSVSSLSRGLLTVWRKAPTLNHMISLWPKAPRQRHSCWAWRLPPRNWGQSSNLSLVEVNSSLHRRELPQPDKGHLRKTSICENTQLTSRRGERMNAFSLRSGTRQGFLLLPLILPGHWGKKKKEKASRLEKKSYYLYLQVT